MLIVGFRRRTSAATVRRFRVTSNTTLTRTADGVKKGAISRTNGFRFLTSLWDRDGRQLRLRARQWGRSAICRHLTPR